jgi:thioredoxin 1
MNVEMARVILLADEEDAKADEEAYAAVQAQQQQQQEEEAKKAEEAQKAEEAKKAKAIAEKKRLEEEKKRQNEIKTVKVDANFDPTKPAGGRPQPSTSAMQPPQGSPKAAKKEDVVFQATSANIQELVLESPVPVLLDVYADWCGPCKALTPALEDMAVKAGGMFRLVKLNTDQERSLSSALEVKSLPTVFGIKDGKILHSFQGMPRSEDFMKNFMMGMFGAGQFNPKVTAEEQKKYDELSNKLVKMAGAAGYSFSQRERLQVRTNNKLDELVEVRGDMADAEETAKILRSLLSNVIRDPFDIRFRRVNLENKIIAARVGAFAPAISILKSVGFVNDKGNPQNSLILGKGKKIVSVAPFVVARDTIDKWIDSNRRAIATAARKKQDEIARAKLLEEAEEVEEESDEEEEVVEKVDPNACTLKVRLEGKNKIHDISLNADDPLSAIIESLPFKLPKGDEIQITCTARRLIVKSSNTEAMKKSLRGHRLAPAASVVVKVIKQKSDTEEGESSNSSIKERAAARRVKKKGEHTMQSIGLYSKDDNAKGELIDGGGGVWYEHDVSDDEGPAEDGDEESSKDDKSK